MAKGGNGFGGMKNAGARPGWSNRQRCLGCRHPIVYGERCPPCQRLVRVKAAKRRRRR